MTLDERNKAIADFITSECLPILRSKGEDYAGKDADPNRNFAAVADALGLTPYQVWAVYFQKQTIALINAIKANPANPATKGEPIRERLIDIINYAGILESMIEPAPPAELEYNDKYFRVLKRALKSTLAEESQKTADRFPYNRARPDEEIEIKTNANGMKH